MAIDLEKLQDSPNLLDILIQMEDVLDSMDIYVFKNWLEGEVVDGPVVRRYWLDFALKYAPDRMPDPRGALRLLKHGLRVDITRAKEEGENLTVLTKQEGEADPDAETEHDIWLVKISIPRRLVVQMNAADHDFYDEEIDSDDVEDAQDDGLDDENVNTDAGQDVGGDVDAGPGSLPDQPGRTLMRLQEGMARWRSRRPRTSAGEHRRVRVKDRQKRRRGSASTSETKMPPMI